MTLENLNYHSAPAVLNASVYTNLHCIVSVLLKLVLEDVLILIHVPDKPPIIVTQLKKLRTTGDAQSKIIVQRFFKYSLDNSIRTKLDKAGFLLYEGKSKHCGCCF